MEVQGGGGGALARREVARAAGVRSRRGARVDLNLNLNSFPYREVTLQPRFARTYRPPFSIWQGQHFLPAQPIFIYFIACQGGDIIFLALFIEKTIQHAVRLRLVCFFLLLHFAREASAKSRSSSISADVAESCSRLGAARDS